MTSDRFVELMRRLEGLPFAPKDYGTHWLGLQDMPEDVLSAAIARSARTREQFPSPAEIREDADAVRSQWVPGPEPEGEPLPEPVDIGVLPDGTRLPRARSVYRFRCEICADSGWKPVGDDGRTVTRCPCWQTNPVLIRARDRQRKYAEARAK